MAAATKNPELVHALIGNDLERATFWRKASKIPEVLYFTFDPAEGRKQFPSTKPLSQGLQRFFRETLEEFSRETGIAFKYLETFPRGFELTNGNLIAINTLDCHIQYNQIGVTSPDLGKTRSLETLNGTPSTPAIEKLIQICPELKKKRSPLALKWVFLHEIFHALGLQHPNRLPDDDQRQGHYEYSGVATCRETIMAQCPEITVCYDQGKKEKCDEMFPKPFYSKEDLIAVAEQEKRAKDPKYISPFETAQGVDIAGEALKVSAKEFISSFIKTLFQNYIKPLLIEKYGINNTKLNFIGYGLNLGIDLCLSSATAVVVSNVTTILFEYLISSFGLDRRVLAILPVIGAAIRNDIDLEIARATVGMVSAGAGAIAALNVIKKLPKIHPELDLKRESASVSITHDVDIRSRQTVHRP